jgi:hypothetical protein
LIFLIVVLLWLFWWEEPTVIIIEGTNSTKAPESDGHDSAPTKAELETSTTSTAAKNMTVNLDNKPASKIYVSGGKTVLHEPKRISDSKPAPPP